MNANNNDYINNSNYDAGFTHLFNGHNIDGWYMAGPGKFVLVEYDKSLQY